MDFAEPMILEHGVLIITFMSYAGIIQTGCCKEESTGCVVLPPFQHVDDQSV